LRDPGLSNLDLQMRFLGISYLLLKEALVRCKFFSEKNLKFIDIIGDILTNLAYLSPFVSSSPRK